MPHTHHILIDYENVCPRDFSLLRGAHVRITAFIGPSQNTARLSLALEEFGENAKIVRVARTGKNALDFHIAYYVGRLAESDPNGWFHIISKDTGYDSLLFSVSHNEHRNAERHTCIDDAARRIPRTPVRDAAQRIPTGQFGPIDEVAGIVGCTEKALRRHATGKAKNPHLAGLPLPVETAQNLLWNLRDVLDWTERRRHSNPSPATPAAIPIHNQTEHESLHISFC